MSFNRRDFLTKAGLTGAGLALADAFNLSQKIADGVISNAYAQQLGVKRVFSLFANGAAPNWMFNLCLYPDADGVIPSAVRIEGMGTGFDSTGKTVFTQHKRGDYWFPKLWFVPIPTTASLAAPTDANTWVNPQALLDNMLTMRGIWNATDGHQIGVRTSFKPLGANASVHGMIADAVSSQYPIPGIVTANSLIGKEFTSLKGINPVNTGSPSSALTTIRDSFKEQVSLFRSNSSLDTLVKSALSKMETNSEFKKSSSNFNRKKAEELIRANLANIVTEFNTRQTKYINLIKLACKYDPANPNTLVPELFDVALTNYSTVQWNPDVPNDINRYFQTGQDLRDLFLTPLEMSDVAASFAMAEVLFEFNLSSNICASISGANTVSPIVLRKDTNVPYASNRVNWGYDNGHSMGLAVQTLLWSVYYRGFITCLNEFITFLKTKNYFNDTVITFGSDFARSPFTGSATVSRSDHGWRANAFTMWSGEIKSPTIIGNTMLDATSVEGSGYKNAWGVGRKAALVNNYIGIGNSNASMATLVGVAPNTSNNKSFIARDSSGIVPLEPAKTT